MTWADKSAQWEDRIPHRSVWTPSGALLTFCEPGAAEHALWCESKMSPSAHIKQLAPRLVVVLWELECSGGRGSESLGSGLEAYNSPPSCLSFAGWMPLNAGRFLSLTAVPSLLRFTIISQTRNCKLQQTFPCLYVDFVRRSVTVTEKGRMQCVASLFLRLCSALKFRVCTHCPGVVNHALHSSSAVAP